MTGALEGRVVWITGAGSGIGRAGALALAGLGASLALSGRRRGALEETARQVAAAGGGDPMVLPVDVSDAEAVQQAADAVIDRHGRLDILVSAAGVNILERHFDRLSVADWDSLIRINLDGAFYCARAVLPHMRARGDGLIVNVASMAGKANGFVSGPAYSASKHGMVSLNASLNIEEGRHGIRACAICPGEVATEILDKRPEPVPPETRAKLLQPEDLGALIAFVATQHPRVCLNEILVTPTHNRGNLALTGRG